MPTDAGARRGICRVLVLGVPNRRQGVPTISTAIVTIPSLMRMTNRGLMRSNKWGGAAVVTTFALVSAMSGCGVSTPPDKSALPESVFNQSIAVAVGATVNIAVDGRLISSAPSVAAVTDLAGADHQLAFTGIAPGVADVRLLSSCLTCGNRPTGVQAVQEVLHVVVVPVSLQGAQAATTIDDRHFLLLQPDQFLVVGLPETFLPLAGPSPAITGPIALVGSVTATNARLFLFKVTGFGTGHVSVPGPTSCQPSCADHSSSYDLSIADVGYSPVSAIIREAFGGDVLRTSAGTKTHLRLSWPKSSRRPERFRASIQGIADFTIDGAAGADEVDVTVVAHRPGSTQVLAYSDPTCPNAVAQCPIDFELGLQVTPK